MKHFLWKQRQRFVFVFSSQKMGKTFLFLALGICILGSPIQADTGFFQFKGKSYASKDLSVADQQKIAEVEEQSYSQIMGLLENAAFEEHVSQLAKKLGKKKEEVEESLLGGAAPTDVEVKAWYDQNQDRIPPNYTLEKVQLEIKKFLTEEKRAKKKKEVLDGLVRSGELKWLTKKPVAPVVSISIEGKPVLGSAKAPVTLIEFADYQCPHCKAASETVKKVLKKYPEKVKFVFMDFPVNPSGISRQIAEGAYCALQQKKYWEYHELAFAKQSELSGAMVEEIAKNIGLQLPEFKTCLGKPDAAKQVEKDQKEGERVGVSGTPTLFVNGKKVSSYEESVLISAIEAELK